MGICCKSQNLRGDEGAMLKQASKTIKQHNTRDAIQTTSTDPTFETKKTRASHSTSNHDSSPLSPPFSFLPSIPSRKHPRPRRRPLPPRRLLPHQQQIIPLFLQLQRRIRQLPPLAMLARVFEQDGLVVFGDPALDDDVVGVALCVRYVSCFLVLDGGL